MSPRLSGCATADATARYAGRFGRAAEGHFRKSLECVMGSVGLGTYLGNPDVETDEAYADSVMSAIESGCNVIDTAANYRFQRSERSIGEALRRLAGKPGAPARDEVVLCTKGGYIPFDGDVPDHPPTYFTETFIKTGIATPRDLVSGMHCMTPKYLLHQLDCSLSNMGVESIDVYYLHNPETQLSVLSTDDFYARVRAAFEALERASSDGKIQWYGCATWNAFRVPPESAEHMSLSRLVGIAREIAGETHRFKVIQMPFNLAMPEALTVSTQELLGDGARMPALEAAESLDLTVFTSVPILQGRLAMGLPDELHKSFPGLTTDAQRAIQFVRSSPHVTAPLVGMSGRNHVKENLALMGIPPLSPTEFAGLFSSEKK